MRCIVVKIRAVTGFSNDFKRAISLANAAATELRNKNYDIQFVRIATNSWEEWCSQEDLPSRASEIEKVTLAAQVDFVSFGPCNPDSLPAVVKAINKTERSFFSSWMNYDQAAVATAIIDISNQNPMNNLRFAGVSNLSPSTPFFPAAFANEEGVAMALEITDDLIENNGDPNALIDSLLDLETVCQKSDWNYLGMDPSIAPPLDYQGSVVDVIELNGSILGSETAESTVESLTMKIRSLPVLQVGYRGVMFAIMEDKKLVDLVTNNVLKINHLLKYAGRCGTGLDTVPLPGNIHKTVLAELLKKVSDISIQKDKPLSARLFPMPGCQIGDTVRSQSPYLLDCPAMDPEA